jgi:hypothetical protein
MYTYGAGSPGTYAGFGAVAPLHHLVAHINAQFARVPGRPTLISALNNALGAAAAGDESRTRSLYAHAQVLAKGQGFDLPHLPARTVISDTAAPAATGGGWAAAINKAVADAAAATAIQASDRTVQPQPRGDAPGVSWVPPEHRATYSDIWAFARRDVGPLEVWQWGVAAGGVLIAASVAMKVLKYGLIGGAVAGGALLAGKAGGLIK